MPWPMKKEGNMEAEAEAATTKLLKVQAGNDRLQEMWENGSSWRLVAPS